MSELYIEIDPREGKILDYPKKLETNWKNIGGLVYLDESQLKDLTWAGYLNSGFIKICKNSIDTLRNFTYDQKIFDDMKITLKDEITSLRNLHESSGVIVNNIYHINIDKHSNIMMLCKYQECLLDPEFTFNWKVTGSFFKFKSDEFINLFLKIQKYIQTLFDKEFELHNEIDKCNNIVELISIDLENISWSDNKIEI
jgi:hypothetical protein